MVSCSTVRIAPQRNIAAFKSFTCLDAFRGLFKVGSKQSKPSAIAKTWGIEMELAHNDIMTQSELAQNLVQFFKKKGFKNVNFKKRNADDSNYFNYEISYDHLGQTHHWSVPHESGFYNEATKKISGFEITTSIMTSKEDELLFKDVVTYLKDLGLSPARGIGGTHVHIGTNNLTIDQLKKIYHAYVESYDELQKYFSSDSGRSYIGASTLSRGHHILRNHYAQDMLVKDMVADGSDFFFQGPIRYNKAYDTLETRFFNSSTSPDELLFNMRFARSFIKKILEDDKFYEQVGEMSYTEIFKKLNLKALH